MSHGRFLLGPVLPIQLARQSAVPVCRSRPATIVVAPFPVRPRGPAGGPRARLGLRGEPDREIVVETHHKLDRKGVNRRRSA